MSAGELVDLRRAHFVGVGGAGMLPVARVCAERGFAVSGSDTAASEALAVLAGLGVPVHRGHASGQVPADATAVVFTHAVAETNPEIVEARRRGIALVHRSAALSALMVGRTAVGVLGTHGKSSTAGMLAFALTGMGLDPSHVVGGDLDGPASGGHCGSADGFFVAEVDESDRTHVGVGADVAVITNISHDHVENYSGEMDHVDAYEKCVRGMRRGGTLVLNMDSAGCRELASRLVMAGDGPRLVTFGQSSSAHWRLKRAVSAGGRSTGVLCGPGGLEFDLAVGAPGVHQLHNAAGAVATLHVLNQDCDAAVEQLIQFEGVRRRMTSAGSAGGVHVYDSFAHHPEEVCADLSAAHSLFDGEARVFTVFQAPDQVRLDAFGAEFAKALSGCSHVVVTGGSRSLQDGALRELAETVRHAGGSASVSIAAAEAVMDVAGRARPGDVVVLMGTGDLIGQGPLLRAGLTELALRAC
ncbi:UDP-N-acetylmuramate--L-alanine ligase [Streptomyces sp. SP17KL33]|uniref:UDP-N-acetylmuramate--L-alanine ligase n=1 Tax=Streptomyces sp. SP17KL33 TaxID=3002534 RepID=UPI002E76C48B|nr:Mur ligase domain-containing protein [Streptomyces sp. SP17KL33]MEE1829701.1 Mur ligase domain-containing protein [Streptomyces sp. SP17KL33]